MRSRSRLIASAVLATAVTVVLASGGTSFADPKETLISPPNHRHFIETPKGDRILVGPQICGNPEMQLAFNQFHYNIHHSFIVPTLGPQAGAPGLHNGVGAELVAERGCG